MAETIWSIIALLGAILVVGMIAYFIATGRDDRAEDEAARRYFDEHGHWPDRCRRTAGWRLRCSERR